jgi:hypothetical protein
MDVTVIAEDQLDLPGGAVLISLKELSEHAEYQYVITPKTKPISEYTWTDKYGYSYKVTDVIIRKDFIKFQDVIVVPSDETWPRRYHIHAPLILDWRTN